MCQWDVKHYYTIPYPGGGLPSKLNYTECLLLRGCDRLDNDWWRMLSCHNRWFLSRCRRSGLCSRQADTRQAAVSSARPCTATLDFVRVSSSASATQHALSRRSARCLLSDRVYSGINFRYYCRPMLCKRGLCRHAVSGCLSVTFVNSVETKIFTVGSPHYFSILCTKCYGNITTGTLPP